MGRNKKKTAGSHSPRHFTTARPATDSDTVEIHTNTCSDNQRHRDGDTAPANRQGTVNSDGAPFKR